MSTGDPTFDELVQFAEGRDEILGLYVFGSRGRDFMVDERSDWDVCVVLASGAARDAFRREFPSARCARVEIVPATLDEIRDNRSEHGRYAAAHADVVLDKTRGALTRVVAEQESLLPGTRDGIVRESLDAYINQTYRSLRYGTRLDAVEAIPYALRTIFALENRIRPYNKYLEWELRHHPVDGWSAVRIEEPARLEGFGDVVDGWEPDVEWLRGNAGYREP